MQVIQVLFSNVQVNHMVLIKTDSIQNVNQSSFLKLNFLIGVSTSLCGGIMSYFLISFMKKQALKELAEPKKELMDLILIINKDQSYITDVITLYLENFCSTKIKPLMSNDSVASWSSSLSLSSNQSRFFYEQSNSDHSFLDQFYKQLQILRKKYPKFKNIHAPTLEEVNRYREHHKNVMSYATTLCLDIKELLLKDHLDQEMRIS